MHVQHIHHPPEPWDETWVNTVKSMPTSAENSKDGHEPVSITPAHLPLTSLSD